MFQQPINPDTFPYPTAFLEDSTLLIKDSTRVRSARLGMTIGESVQPVNFVNERLANWSDDAFTATPTSHEIDHNVSIVKYMVERISDDVSTTSQWDILRICVSQGAKFFDKNFVETLNDLNNVVEEAKEEELSVPSDIAIRNTRELLYKLYARFPCRFEVYPMPDSEIAIDIPDKKGSSVLILCDSDGGALCLVNVKSGSRRARYPNTLSLPDGFITEAIEELFTQVEIT